MLDAYKGLELLSRRFSNKAALRWCQSVWLSGPGAVYFVVTVI